MEGWYTVSTVGTGDLCVFVYIGGSPKARAHLENLDYIAREEVRMISDIDACEMEMNDDAHSISTPCATATSPPASKAAPGDL